MKHNAISIIGIIAMTSSAVAADLPSRRAPTAYVPPPAILSWTGFYAGLNLGGGWSAGNGNNNVWNLGGANGGVTNNIGGSNGSGGIIGGAQVGYNYQFGGLGNGIGAVVGAEADFQGTSMGSGNGNYYGYVANIGSNGTLAYVPSWVGNGVNIPWYGTVRGRLGLTVLPTLLLYGTGGFAYAGINSNGYNYWGSTRSATQTGWTAGAGAEWMFMPNWSAKAEYLYTDVSGSNSNEYGWNYGVGINNVNNHTRWNTIRAGVNYHFNWGNVASTMGN
jgi:outer membrane immunogenic protein